MEIAIPDNYRYKLQYLFETYSYLGIIKKSDNGINMENELICYIIDKEFSAVACEEKQRIAWNELIKKNDKERK